MRSDFSLKTFPQQDVPPTKAVTRSSTEKYSHENLVENSRLFVQDFVPIKTATLQVPPQTDLRDCKFI